MDHGLSLPIAFMGGLASFLSPCVLAMVPTYLFYLGGERGRPWKGALFFVVGFSFVFILLGLPFSLLGGFVQTYKQGLARAGGILIGLFGLKLWGVPLPFFEWSSVQIGGGRAPHGAQTPWGGLLLGLTLGVAWLPCIGPILGAILTWTALQGGAESIALLGAYASGLSLPFLVSAFFTEGARRWIRRYGQSMVWVEKAAGAVMVATGLLLVTGAFDAINRFLVDVTPDWLWERL